MAYNPGEGDYPENPYSPENPNNPAPPPPGPGTPPPPPGPDYNNTKFGYWSNDPEKDLFGYLNDPSGGSIDSILKQWNSKYGGYGKDAVWYPDTKTIGLPSGGPWGEYGSYLVAPHTGSAGDTWQKVARGKETSQATQNPGPTIPTPNTAGQPYIQDPKWGALYDQLMKRSQQSLDLNPNDPIIASQTNAFNAKEQQQMRDYLSGIAEKSGPTANIGAETRSVHEGVAQDTAGFQATLLANELSARRNEIQQALTQMGGMLTAEQSMALQRELGLIDAALRQQGLNSGNDQFLASLGLQATNQSNYWDAIRSGLITG